jgi:hypothetical protein
VPLLVSALATVHAAVFITPNAPVMFASVAVQTVIVTSLATAIALLHHHLDLTATAIPQAIYLHMEVGEPAQLHPSVPQNGLLDAQVAIV